jgi:AcrR family transcriptional regulator
MRAHILAEAARLFAAQGYWSTTVEQIANRADVAQATFFNHFPTKAAVLKELAVDMFDAFEASLTTARGDPGTRAEERLEAFFVEAQAVVEGWRGRMPDTILNMVRVIALSEEGRDVMERLLLALSALLYEGQRRGEVRRDIDAAFLADLVRATFVAVLLNWLNDPRFPLAMRLRQGASFAIGAVCAAPSHPPTETGENS